MSCTLKNVAEAAGVGVSTASYVLSGSGLHKVGEATRKRILETAARLGYRVNMAGRMLHGGASKTIGILECQRSVVIFAELMQLVCAGLHGRGYQTYYRIGENRREYNKFEQEAVDDFLSHGVDGVMIAYFDQSRIFPRRNCPVPLTVFEGGDWDVGINLEQGAYLLAKHLLGHGHRRIGYLLPDDTHNAEKLHGYRRALAEAGIEADPAWVIKVFPNPDWQGAIERGVRDLKLSAICCSNDFYAVKLMTWLQWRGYRVPDDVAITGFDGVALVNSLQVPLTTLIQPVEQLADLLVETMILKIERQTMTRLIEPQQLSGRLHIGRSCGCAAPVEPNIDWSSIKVYLDTVKEEKV